MDVWSVDVLTTVFLRADDSEMVVVFYDYGA